MNLYRDVASCAEVKKTLAALAVIPARAAGERESAPYIPPYCKDRDVAGCTEMIRKRFATLTPLTAMPAEDRESAANILPYCKDNLTLKERLDETFNARMNARCAGFVFQMGMKREASSNATGQLHIPPA